jgi:serine/threonine protein kinase/Tol biopolymer transport system component
LIGTTVSHYQILERLGGGGMGVVYKARDLKLGRLVALKFLSSQRGAPEEEKRRFLREARAASQLDHPNICTIHEIDETEDGALFIAMAFCEGQTLSERLARGPLPVAQAVDLALQIAAGLAQAHKRGIIHRDVKPANIAFTNTALTAGGQVKILDFGIARLADQSQLTMAGMAVGTAAYMAPEQFRGEPAGPRSDVWSLGVVLYQMVTGRHPFQEPSSRETVRAILERDPRPMSELRAGVPGRLDGIVARALSKQPAGRYPSMEALQADLRSLAGLDALREDGEDPDRTLIGVPGPASGLLGRTVGPYRVSELLGGGGMGVVYKAEDTRLSRTVALKFLPPELTRDPEAKARFTQEARAASSLDHPNLCTILDLGETGDGQLYIAMPCYDGETLLRKIERGPLPLEEALDVALQTARGLAKAHKSGIVHRDIKPANLIVTSDGVVKILDFGLAKLVDATLTRAHPVAGTPAYMSPEQAREEGVDHRTDLWSLGVVLYEMLAGRRPFRGESGPAVVYAILNERPRPLRELRPEIPPELEKIVDRLLAKDLEARYPSIETPLAGIRSLLGESTTHSVPAWQGRGFRLWVLGALAGVAVLAGLLGYLLRNAETPAGGEPVQASLKQMTDLPGLESFPSLAPDGEYFAYSRKSSPGNEDIYLQRTGGSNTINLTADSPVDDTHPAFSPDGQTIAFRSEREGGGIFLMGATGESVRRLAPFGYNPAWSPNGKEVLMATEPVSDPRVRRAASQVWRVEVATGARRLIRVQGDAVQPSWSPHGWRIAYWGLPPNSSKRVIWTVPAQGGEAVPVLDDEFLNWSPVWSPDGQYLYLASNRSGSMNLWRVPIDESSGRVRGPLEPVTTSSEWSGLPSLSRDGRRILYATNESKARLARAALDPGTLKVSGPLEPVIQGARGIRSCDVSPDGQWLAFHSTLPQEDLFVIRTDGTGLRQLTDDAFRDRYPRWSPDGTRLLFQSDRGERGEIWMLRRDGSALQPLTHTTGRSPTYPVWSPDGREATCTIAGRGTLLFDLSRKPGESRLVPLPPVTPDGQLFNASSWSPDGRWLAGGVEFRNAKSLPGIVLYSRSSRSYSRLTDRGQSPRWLPDSRALLFRDEGGIYAVDLTARKIRKVLALPADAVFVAHAVAPDGRTLYVAQAEEAGDICMLTLR